MYIFYELFNVLDQLYGRLYKLCYDIHYVTLSESVLLFFPHMTYT